MAFLFLLQYVLLLYMHSLDSYSILKETESVIVEFLISEPFYGQLLAKMNKAVSTNFHGISIAHSIQNGVQICINPNYWNNLIDKNSESDKQLFSTILKRQLLHFIFKHDLEMHSFKNLPAFILACECVVNPFLEKEDQIQLDPPLPSIKQLKLPPYKTLQFYYDAIISLLENKQIDHIKIDGKYPFEYIKTWKTNRKKGNNVLIELLRNQFIFSQLDSKKKSQILESNAKLFEYINFLKKASIPSINWKKILRTFYARSKRTKSIHTNHRNSKRYGTFPGTKIKKQPKILIALDTSASIKANDLNLFFTEIQMIIFNILSIQKSIK